MKQSSSVPTRGPQKNFRHVFTIVDSMMDEALHELPKGGREVTCHRGCSHCCHLLVEVSWEEAQELARWIVRQTPERQAKFQAAVKRAAREAKQFFMSRKATRRYAEPVREGLHFPEYLFNRYFLDKARPCPFLDGGACAAYEARPTPCRLHVVTSAPELCSREVIDDSKYRVPRRVERVQREIAPVITAMTPDGRWGQLAIMVDAVMRERAY